MAYRSSTTLSLRCAAALVVLLAGCESDQLPAGSVVLIAPAQRSFEIIAAIDTSGRCVIDERHYLDLPLVVSVQDANGSPIGRVPFEIHADYAGNSYPGSTVLTLFDDADGDGVVSEDDPAVSDFGSPAFGSDTRAFTGERRLLLRVNLSCPYAGRVLAMAAGRVAALTVDVHAVGFRAAGSRLR